MKTHFSKNQENRDYMVFEGENEGKNRDSTKGQNLQN